MAKVSLEKTSSPYRKSTVEIHDPNLKEISHHYERNSASISVPKWQR